MYTICFYLYEVNIFSLVNMFESELLNGCNARPTAVSTINFIGNFGGAAGNIIFYIILDIHCLSAFLTIGCLALGNTVHFYCSTYEFK